MSALPLISGSEGRSTIGPLTPHEWKAAGRGLVSVAVVDAFGMPPQDAPALPAGMRVAQLRTGIDLLGTRSLFALGANGVLHHCTSQRNAWNEIARGIRRVRISETGDTAALLGADGSVTLVSLSPTHEAVFTHLPSVTSCADVAFGSRLDGTTVTYALSHDGELTVHRMGEQRVVDKAVTAIASRTSRYARLMYAARGELRRGAPDGYSARLGARRSTSLGRLRTKFQAIATGLSFDGVEVAYVLDSHGKLHAWSSDAPSCRVTAATDVTVMAPQPSATRSVVATRSGALRWVYANGITLHVGAGPLPHATRATQLRTAALPNGRTAIYALGSDNRLYACDSAATQWQIIRENTATFDLLPHGAAIVASR